MDTVDLPCSCRPLDLKVAIHEPKILFMYGVGISHTVCGLILYPNDSIMAAPPGPTGHARRQRVTHCNPFLLLHLLDLSHVVD